MSNWFSSGEVNAVRIALTALLCGCILDAVAVAAEVAADEPASAVAAVPVFAKVGDVVISQQEYDAMFAVMNRGKFFHRRPPEAEIAAMQREVGNKLIANVLLLREAKKRKLQPDDAVVRKKIEQYEQRYANDAQWLKARAEALPLLTQQWQEEDLLSQLEKQVRNVPPPKEAALRKYYAAHLDKFTEPEQLRVSTILLSVDPSSPTEAWQQAFAEGQELVSQLQAGADFAELARQHSGDTSSAERGGDMGYLHGGMLAEAAQSTVDKLKPGETSDPIRVLEGIVILRLTDRKQPKLSKFETVRESARAIWLREEGERVWRSLIERLKKETPIYVDESRYLPLPKGAEGAAVPNK